MFRGAEWNGTTRDGVLPMLDFKVSFFLSDHTEPGHACTLVLPGSHLWTQEERRHWAETLDPSRVVALRVPAGSAVLWRNQIMHAVVRTTYDPAIRSSGLTQVYRAVLAGSDRPSAGPKPLHQPTIPFALRLRAALDPASRARLPVRVADRALQPAGAPAHRCARRCLAPARRPPRVLTHQSAVVPERGRARAAQGMGGGALRRGWAEHW